MMDWLSSKFIMIIAAVLIIASAIALISIQRESLEDLELKNIANKIADNVNSVTISNAETRLVMRFEDKEGTQSLPMYVGGNGYNIDISKYSVTISQGSKRFIVKLSTGVHLWNSTKFKNEGDLAELDEEHKLLSISSDSYFIIESKMLNMEEGNEYHTFVYQE